MKMLLVATGIALAAAGASRKPGDPPIVLHPLMKDIVAPQAQILWDVGNRVMDDNGDPDARKLSSADWAKLLDAAQKMKDVATRLAAAPHVILAAPGTKMQDEGAPGSSTQQQMQSYIDGDPKGFGEHSQKLAAVSNDFLEAARTRNAAKLMDASGRLDEVCEGCHVKFWYPKQDGG